MNQTLPVDTAVDRNDAWLIAHTRLMANSFQSLTGKALVDCAYPDPVTALDTATAIIVSHGTQADPIFNYANQQALRLFEMDWETFTRLPSRYSAEAPERSERERLLREVSEQGFIQNYTGVRIAASGRRFYIRNAIVWNLLDDKGAYHGQAATFSDWEYL
ncbi:MEKHLA domain-containing protein [Kistimonas asteriae]|uniref:MEKHLA domain-containing protein n=1 Tax=Kistimonas asteriae TaxID=517724 RepID=UPI001BAD9007|nr:MEKHLA domain-containing protein [Kistimonas asteriae]